MNNNYDPNQQYQAPQQPQYQQYQAPQQADYQYQQQNYQYQQPLYQQAPAVNTTSFFVLAIVGLALSCSFYLAIAGIIVSAIALSKAKNYFAMGGLNEGKAKVAKILSTIGLWSGVGMTVFFVIYVIYMIVLISAASASAYDPYSYYYY